MIMHNIFFSEVLSLFLYIYRGLECINMHSPPFFHDIAYACMYDHVSYAIFDAYHMNVETYAPVITIALHLIAWRRINICV